MFLRFKNNIPIIITLIFFILIIVSFSGYVPLWDAWETTDLWLLKAVSLPFNLINFDNFGHPSMLYFLLIALPQYLDFGNVTLLHLTIGFFNLLAILAFYGLAKFLFLDISNTLEINLLTFLYAIFPIIISSSLHITPDNGILVFFVIFLYFLLTKKYFLTVLTGIAMAFTKEIGLILYLEGIILYFLIYVNTSVRGSSHRNLNIIKKVLFWGIPVWLSLIRIVLYKYFFHRPFMWLGASNILQPNYLTYWPQLKQERIFFSYLLAIFVTNFNWILSIFSIIALIYFLYGIVVKKQTFFSSKSNIKFIYITFIFFATFIVITAFKSFTNFRYFLPVYPLLIILFYYGLIILIKNIVLRKICLFIVITLFVIGNFKTMDPLSKKIYGTFKFGDHDMLKITSITNECCGYGRDQLVYNLEFIQIHYLLNIIFRDIKPTPDIGIGFQPIAGVNVITRLDNKTFERTLRYKNVFIPNILSFRLTFSPNKPKLAYYIELPIEDNQSEISLYKEFYDVVEIKYYDHLGYSLRVYKLKLRGS